MFLALGILHAKRMRHIIQSPVLAWLYHIFPHYPVKARFFCGWGGGGGKLLNIKCVTWCFSDRASWINYTLITKLMHWLLFIHKILFYSTCFEPQVLSFRRIQLYTCSMWYCHSLWEFLVACWYTAWVRTLIESDSTLCCMYTTVFSWRWALEARNMYRRIVFYV